jgi:hypothetical protein
VRTRDPISATTGSESVRNVKNKSAQHSVSTVNNFFAFLAMLAYTRKEHDRNISAKVCIYHLNSEIQAKIKVKHPVWENIILMKERVNRRGKILLTLNISTKVAYITKRKILNIIIHIHLGLKTHDLNTI